MSTAQIIWVIVAIAAVAVLVAVVWFASHRSGQKAERHRARAAELRQEADAHRADLEESEEHARRAAAEAEQAEAEAQRARAQAVEAEREAAVDEAHVRDRLRDADRIDPDADTGADASHVEGARANPAASNEPRTGEAEVPDQPHVTEETPQHRV